MQNEQSIESADTPSSRQSVSSDRQVYRAPELLVYGAVRQLTQSGSGNKTEGASGMAKMA